MWARGIAVFESLAARRKGWLPNVAIVFGSCLISFLLFGRQAWLADWGLIDDHEIFYFLGNRQRLPLGEVISTLLSKTEVGSLEGRFRPLYYTLRVLETTAWGQNVHFWYGAHALAFAFFIGGIWWVVCSFLGLLPSALAITPIVCANFWGATWGRLGPAEIYAAPAIALFVAGSYEVFFAESAVRRNLGYAILTISALLVIGIKETLLPFGALALFILALAVYGQRLSRWHSTFAATIVIAVCSLVSWIVSRQLGASGTDIYAQPLNPTQRIAVALSSLRQIGIGDLLVYVVILGMTVSVSIDKLDKRKTIIALVGIVGLSGFLVALYISQQLAYNGTLPTGTRYDFPAMLVPKALIILTGCFLISRIRLTKGDRTAHKLAICFGLMIAVHTLATGGLRGLHNSFAMAEYNINTTRDFTSELLKIITKARASPSAAIVLEAYGPVAYEPVFSMQRYLRAAGITNAIAVRFHSTGKIPGHLQNDLEATLITLQDHGDSRFAPLTGVTSTASCISIGINGAADAKCSGFHIQV